MGWMEIEEFVVVVVVVAVVVTQWQLLVDEHVSVSGKIRDLLV